MIAWTVELSPDTRMGRIIVEGGTFVEDGTFVDADAFDAWRGSEDHQRVAARMAQIAIGGWGTGRNSEDEARFANGGATTQARELFCRPT